jgi:hypothetical protein
MEIYIYIYIYNLGFRLLCNTSDNLLDLNKGPMQPIIGMVGVWKWKFFIFYVVVQMQSHL